MEGNSRGIGEPLRGVSLRVAVIIEAIEGLARGSKAWGLVYMERAQQSLAHGQGFDVQSFFDLILSCRENKYKAAQCSQSQSVCWVKWESPSNRDRQVGTDNLGFRVISEGTLLANEGQS